MRIRATLFDLDGTLLDSLEDLASSVNYALKSAGFPPRSQQEVRTFVGNGARVLLERAVPRGTDEEGVMACLSLFREHYQQNLSQKTKPYEGIEELLCALQRGGIAVGVISNKPDVAVKPLCAQWFGDRVQVAIGEGGEIRPKPIADGVNKALKELKVPKEQAVYIGDTAVDVQTAKNAGLRSVGVSWGFRGRDELMAAGADWIIDHPKELLAILEQI